MQKPDSLLVAAVIILLLFGILTVYDASVVYAHDVFGGKYHFLILHSLWVGIGSLLAFFLSRFDYHRLAKIAPFLLFASSLLLILVLLPGVGVKIQGARRWFSLRYFMLQPTELAKLSFVIYLASWLSPGKRKKPRHNFLAFCVLLLLLVGLIVAQPDVGTAVVLGAIGVWVYFVSGAPLRHFFVSLPLLLAAALGLILLEPYRKARLLTFLNPNLSDPLSTGYHIKQILIALGSGGPSGLGWGQSRQKYLYLPSVMTDSIFAVVGEELGFVGAVFVLLIFALLFFRIFLVVKKAPDRFGKLLAAGIAGWLSIQTLVNLGAMVTLIPLTGIPLPLISYGGSSTVCTLAGIGILLNISSKGKRK